MARANELVGRQWAIKTDLNADGRVVGLRTGKLNDILKVMRPGGDEPVYARVMELSESSRVSPPSMHPTVTVVFSSDKARIEAVTVRTYKEVIKVRFDLTEDKVAALGLRWEDGRFWTEEELAREKAEDEFCDPPGLLTEAEVDAAAKAAADALEGEREAAWAQGRLGDAERAAAEAAEEAAWAVSTAAELEKAAAAAAVLLGDGGVDSLFVFEAADKEASRAASEAAVALEVAQVREGEKEAAVVQAARAQARVSPIPMVTPAVTRSRMRLSEALEMRASQGRASAGVAAARYQWCIRFF